MSPRIVFHKIVYHIGLFFARFTILKYNFSHGKRMHLTEPTIVISNHTTESDMIFVASCFYEHMYIFAGEHLLRSKFGGFIKTFFDPIAAPKGGSHLPSIKEMTKRLKDGCNIMLFPEGSRSFNGITEEMGVSLGKLIKISKCGLATCHTTGGYFVAPRWGYHFRKGPVTCEVKHILTSEELKGMKPQEIIDLINKDLYENAYETQRMKPKKYKGQGLAEGLENYLLICPNCGKYETFTAKDDSFECSACGLKGIYTEEGFLKKAPDSKTEMEFDSVADWGKWMEKRFDEDMSEKAPDELLFQEENVKLFRVDAEAHTSEDISVGTLFVYSDRMEFGEKVIPYSDISEAAMLYFGKTLMFTDSEGYFGLTGENFHAWKETRLYRNYNLINFPKKAMNAF